jgi:hypothetical protein
MKKHKNKSISPVTHHNKMITDPIKGRVAK